MMKRWIVPMAALALSALSFADGDPFARMWLSPITWTKSVDAYLGGKTSTWFIQPTYEWASGFTAPGVLGAYGMRPSTDDYRGATLFAARWIRNDPDAGDQTDTTMGMISHLFTGKDSPYMAGATVYYTHTETVGNQTGANFEVGTMLFANDKDPGFMVTGGINYAQMDPEAGDTTRGAGLSINVGRMLSDKLSVEYDHTFASKFGGAQNWFFRTTWDAKPGTQLRFTVGSGETFMVELGFFLGAR